MHEAAGRRGLRQRIFAWCYAQNRESHPDPLMDNYKREIFADLQGDLLEIGPGTGDNLRYLPQGTRWIGLEPNVYMQTFLQDALSMSDVQGEIRTGTAESTNMPDASMDGVISSFVLCSVTNLDAALAEIMRVLRPGGRFAFMEHVAAPEGTVLRRTQHLITPVWRFVADGCHPNRDIEAAIRRAGFSSVEIQSFRAPEPIVSPRIAGVAAKAEV